MVIIKIKLQQKLEVLEGGTFISYKIIQKELQKNQILCKIIGMVLHDILKWTTHKKANLTT